MRKIAISCMKGGSSKTTTATSLAIGMAARGKRVLLIDTDASCNATWLLTEGQGADGPDLADVLSRDAAALDAIRPTNIEGLDLLPASPALGGVGATLAQEPTGNGRLRSVMSVIDDYDFAIADTGPSMTTLLINVLVWATDVIVPCDPGIYAVIGLRDLTASLAEIAEVYRNDELHLEGLVLTKVAHNNVHRDLEKTLREGYPTTLYKTTIPASIKVEEAQTRGQSVMRFAPKSPVATAYMDLVDEVLNGRATNRSRGTSKRTRASGDAA